MFERNVYKKNLTFVSCDIFMSRVYTNRYVYVLIFSFISLLLFEFILLLESKINIDSLDNEFRKEFVK